MKKINIEYLDEVFEIRLSKINAFPYDVFKIDFEGNSLLFEVMESPIFITEKPEGLLLPEVQNTEQIDLLNSFALGIEESYFIL